MQTLSYEPTIVREKVPSAIPMIIISASLIYLSYIVAKRRLKR